MLLDAPVARVTEDPLLLVMQELIDDPEIVGVGGGRLQAVDHTLHEVPQKVLPEGHDTFDSATSG